MTRRDDLVRLRDALEHGEWVASGGGDDSWLLIHDAGLRNLYGYFYEAWDRGSINAAMAAHKALLPGWDIQMGTYEDTTFEASVSNPLKVRTFDGVSDTLARAWLIAILNALIAQEGAP